MEWQLIPHAQSLDKWMCEQVTGALPQVPRGSLATIVRTDGRGGTRFYWALGDWSAHAELISPDKEEVKEICVFYRGAEWHLRNSWRTA